MHCPQVKLLDPTPVGQLIAEPNLVFLEFNRSLEIERRNIEANTRAQHAALPGFGIQSPGRGPQFPVIGQIASLPGTRRNGREAFVQADERTALEVVAGAIAEKFASAGRVPEPLASGAQIFERNDPSAEFRNDGNLDILVAQNE